MTRTIPALLLLLAANASAAMAQVAPLSACAFDTAQFTRSQSVIVGIAPAGPDLAPSAGMDEVLWMADAIATHFKAPARLNLPLWARISGGAPTMGVPGRTVPLGYGLDAWFSITLRPDGKLADQEIRVSSSSNELNLALQRAALAADSAGAIPALSDSLRESGGRASFRLINMRGARITGVPLMEVSIPQVFVTRPVQLIKPPAVKWPGTAGDTVVSDSLEITFVVNDDGTIRSGQVWPLRSLYPDAFQAVVEALAATTLEPARVGECAVPSLVRQRLHFRTRR